MKSLKAKFAVLLLATSLSTTFSQLPDSGGTGSGAMSNPAGAPLDGGVDNTSKTRTLDVEEERNFDSIDSVGESERNLRMRSLDPNDQRNEVEIVEEQEEDIIDKGRRSAQELYQKSGSEDLEQFSE